MFGSVDDSDQSISEEEDLDVGYSGNCAVSLGSPSENKGRSIRILSQIETLDKVYCGFDGTTNPRQSGLFIEDEIEFPLFNNKDNSVHSPRRPHMFGTADGFTCFNGLISTYDSNEDNVCQEQKASPTLRYPKRGRGGDAWSEASKEVEALAQCLKIRPSLTNGSISKPNKSVKAGGRGKLKAKFSFRPGLCKGEFFPAESGTNTDLYPADLLKTKVFNPSDPRAEFLEDGGLKVEQPEESANSYQMAGCDDHRDHSVAELLDNLQGSSLLQGNSETHKWRLKRKMVLKTNDILADDTEMDQDMLTDVWSSPSEEDDGPQGPTEEDNSLNRKSVFPCTKVVHFQDVFDAVSPKYRMPKAMFEGLSGNALFERLQNLLLIKNEADVDFLKKSQMDFNLIEASGCLNVKILSRSLEAKLTVCCCSLVEGDEKRIMTVIFNSRACDSFELEVGNLVRVHHPWKEINIMGNDGAVILSTYFSKL